MSRRIRQIRWLVAGLGLAALTIPATATAGGQNQRYLDGWYGYAISLTQQQRQQTSAVLDGRAPDTRDAAYAYQQQSSTALDGRSPDTIDAALAAQNVRSTPIDGRSPDTTDAALQAHSPVLTVFRTPGFQWGDFGIGGGAALAAALLLLLSIRVATHRRGSTPVPMA